MRLLFISILIIAAHAGCKKPGQTSGTKLEGVYVENSSPRGHCQMTFRGDRMTVKQTGSQQENEFVYSIKDGILFLRPAWDEALPPSEFTIRSMSRNRLEIQSLHMRIPEQPVTFDTFEKCGCPGGCN